MLMNKALLMASGKKRSIRYFEFVATKAGSDVDLFSGSAPASWVVYVNGAPTSQSANALTFSLGDTVRIEYDETPAATFTAAGRNYLKTIDGAIPVVESTNFLYCFANCYDLTSIPAGLFANNPNVTNFSNCFANCNDLTSIPAGLFANNPNVTNFSDCFFNCSRLTSIPAGLFANNPNVTNFSDCFMECSRLTSIPAGLFANNPNVTNFSYCFFNSNGITSIPDGLFANNPNVTNFSGCFEYCIRLTVRVRISSAKVSSAAAFAGDTKAKGTVYVPSGSKTASTFKSTTNANVTVVEE